MMKENIKNKNVWVVGKADHERAKEIEAQLKLPAFLCDVLAVSGFENNNEILRYLNCSYNELCDPFLLTDMDKAVARIRAALDSKEKIMIYGDYDVDGVTSVAVLYRYLIFRGADVGYYIPERINEGYGLNESAIGRFAADGVTLIITVDSGITAHGEIEFARENGIDVVITDHHECREELPQAVAVVNPHRDVGKYPFTDLAGVGVVFKLLCAMENNKNVSNLCSKYSDLVALGTVADVMPLTGENRVIVKVGLKALENTKNQGLCALVAQSFSERRNARRKNLTANSIGFGLAPRINAAGRIGDVNKALQLLITEDKGQAENIALYLCAINRERQLIENNIFNEAIEQIESCQDFDDDKIIVLTSDKWHLGVVGIVASKLTERYKLPSILISTEGNIGKGSARSVKGFNINEAISECKDLLVKYGGHELAAGLTIEKENIPLFRKRINEFAKRTFNFDDVCTYINAEFEIGTTDVTVEHALELQKLEPFGLQNPVPLFCIRAATICEIYSIGDGKHLKMIIEKDGCRITALYFGMSKERFPFVEGNVADFMCSIDMNDFRGTLSVQALVKDVRMEESQQVQKERNEKLFVDILDGKCSCPETDMPGLNQFKAVFLYIKRAIGTFDKEQLFDTWQTSQRVSHDYGVEVSSVMLNVILCVFCEMKLIKLVRNDASVVSISLFQTEGKVNLYDSQFLTRINQREK